MEREVKWFFWSHAFHEIGAAAGIAVGNLLTSDFPECALLIVSSALVGLWMARKFNRSHHSPQPQQPQPPQQQQPQQQQTNSAPRSSRLSGKRVGPIVLYFLAASLAFSYVIAVLVPGLSFLREDGEDAESYNYNPIFRQFAMLALVAGGTCWGFERRSLASYGTYSLFLRAMGGLLSCIITFSILFM